MFDFIDQKKVVYITFSVILFISAIIAPIGVFYPIKSMFITPAAYEIGTSSISMITGGIGLALLACGLVVLATMEQRVKKYGAAFILFVVGIAGVSFSLTDYYYITSENFVHNAPFALTSEKYEWTDFEKVEERIIKENGVTKVNAVTFYMKDGTVLDMKAGAILSMTGTIKNSVERSGGNVERIQEDEV
ncbi:hypothetical protein [Metaplanococcus flavidus]|uniref:Uncharacterized protein n=1 Tax=Metaplanococcus flavidus TaxID=569883 RepID=A0ABW3L973_9BACL